MRKLLGVAAALSLVALIGFTAERGARAHGTCFDGACCSPHGQNSSSTGYWFNNCYYTPNGVGNQPTWYRSFNCSQYICSDDTGNWNSGAASAMGDHNVYATTSYCGGSGESCDLWGSCCNGFTCSGLDNNCYMY
jgi:hypothetical protein